MKSPITGYLRLAEVVIVVVLLGVAAYTWNELDRLRRLPVTLPNYEFEIGTPAEPGTSVTTRGTWVTAGGIPEPVQTTTIECRKAAMRCVQSSAVIAFIDGKGLMESVQIDFEVERWTDREVATKAADDKCAKRTLTLDLAAKRARSRVLQKRETNGCPELPDRTLELVAGYKSRNPDPK